MMLDTARTDEFHGRAVTVMGLGRQGGGVPAVRWLASRGAVLTITDSAPAETLTESLAAITDVPICRRTLGRHVEEDFIGADLIVVNPAVRPEHPLLVRAAERGTPMVTEMELFLQRCRAPMVGVTGSNGKSTTAAMIAAILESQGFRVHLGGNIGRSLLPVLGEIAPDDQVVLELSSFQLAWLSRGCPVPSVVVVTGFTPNHLDWHESLEAYRGAKLRLVRHCRGDGRVILSGECEEILSWRRHATAAVDIVAPVGPTDLLVPGPHNKLAAALAARAAEVVGCTIESIRVALSHFAGLEFRLQRVGEGIDRRFYNDSASTTPESTLAAIAAVGGRKWILVGGRDKGFDFAPLIRALTQHTDGAAFYGSVGPRLIELVRDTGKEYCCVCTRTLDDALTWAVAQSAPNDAIVLSPGCAGTDQFLNYVERGRRFNELVSGLRPR